MYIHPGPPEPTIGKQLLMHVDNVIQVFIELSVLQQTLDLLDDVQDRPEIVSSIDLLPTSLSAASSPIPAGLPGLTLLPTICDGEPLDRAAIFGECFAHDVASPENLEESLLYRWCIEQQWKLLIPYNGDAGRHAAVHRGNPIGRQLYDLEQDPHERHDVAASHPNVVARLARRIDQWWPVLQQQQRASAPAPE